ncbi:MAG: ATP-dependent RNA helicase HrpA [Planctomycetota bacterium]|nr:ATP-dependent RNA helicase HrpA [Planctomycetota bacterium]
MSSLTDLEGQIGQALRPDRHRFRSRLRAIRDASRSGKPFDRNLAKLTEEIAQSVALREARKAALPTVSFDDTLPVSARREEIAQAIRDNQVVVVCGETGSGKSTQLPKICLEVGRGIDGLIGHTQPRRIAARSIAARVADELKSPIGGAVGFKIRFTDETGPKTFIKLMTDGILLAESQRDKFLTQYDTIIIDEAHERSLNIDFLMGYLKRLLPKRPDLKVILTSATIDAERFAEHFATTQGPAPIVMVSGRTYPVEVRYRPVVAEDEGVVDEEPDWDRAILSALHEVAEIDDGDVLVFLPTERDIHDMSKLLRGVQFAGDRAGKKTEVLPLYARLPTSEQNRVFARHPHRRIVLATNVAESSLTVPGIRYVIDPGTARISRYSARSKMLRLPIEPISQASADQRKGRCGRVGPGVCLRLYSPQDFATREKFTAPEVQRTSLASVILQLKSLDFGEIEEFPFLDPPKTEAIRDGYKTLFELGALDEEQNLTPLGRRIARIPLDPRVARIVLAGEEETCLSEVLIIAAVLELQDPRERPVDKQQAADECHSRFLDEESDFLSYLKLWDFFDELKHKLSRSALRKACHQNFLSYNRVQEWLDVHRQLLDMVSELGLKPRPRKNDGQAIHRALLTGLLSNVAMKGEGSEYTVGGGGKVFLWPGSGLLQHKPKWVVAGEQIETSKRYLRTIGKIDPGWIERLASHLVKRSYSDPAWDPERACVRAFEKVSLSGLPIVARRSVNYGPIESVLSRELFIRHALVQGEFQTPGKFRERNQQLIDELTALEKKARQPGLLKDDEARYEFFDKRIPSHVFDGARFEKWRKMVEWEQPDILVMQRSDLLVDEAPEIQPADFPDAVSVQHMQLPLEYRFHPGESDDGITLTVPMQGLNQLDPRRLGWLVPGLLSEKLIAMIKSLPKPVRRLLIPANETAQRVLKELKFGVGDFASEVAAILSRLSREQITPDLFNTAQLPTHLQLNIRVVDSAGEQLAAGRDLAALRESLGAEASRSFTQMSADDPRWKKEGVTKWDFGDLPLEVALTRGGLELKGYPALVDTGEAVAVRLMDSAVRATTESRSGLRRLFVLSHAKELKTQVNNLPGIEDRRTLGATLEWERTLKAQLVELVADRALYRNEAQKPVARPVNAAEWTGLAREGGARIGLAVQDITELVGPLLKCQQEAKYALDRVGVAPPLQNALRDPTLQFKELTKPGYLTTTPWQWLQQFPRYFRAIRVRLEKLTQGGLARDQKACERLAPFLRAYAQRAEQHQTRGIQDPQLQLFRWLIEEFRVSVFAQELKTFVAVSEKRLEEQWAKVSL